MPSNFRRCFNLAPACTSTGCGFPVPCPNCGLDFAMSLPFTSGKVARIFPTPHAGYRTPHSPAQHRVASAGTWSRPATDRAWRHPRAPGRLNASHRRGASTSKSDAAGQAPRAFRCTGWGAWGFHRSHAATLQNKRDFSQIFESAKEAQRGHSFFWKRCGEASIIIALH